MAEDCFEVPQALKRLEDLRVLIEKIAARLAGKREEAIVAKALTHATTRLAEAMKIGERRGVRAGTGAAPAREAAALGAEEKAVEAELAELRGLDKRAIWEVTKIMEDLEKIKGVLRGHISKPVMVAIAKRIAGIMHEDVRGFKDMKICHDELLKLLAKGVEELEKSGEADVGEMKQSAVKEAVELEKSVQKEIGTFKKEEEAFRVNISVAIAKLRLGDKKTSIGHIDIAIANKDAQLKNCENLIKIMDGIKRFSGQKLVMILAARWERRTAS